MYMSLVCLYMYLRQCSIPLLLSHSTHSGMLSSTGSNASLNSSSSNSSLLQQQQPQTIYIIPSQVDSSKVMQSTPQNALMAKQGLDSSHQQNIVTVQNADSSQQPHSVYVVKASETDLTGEVVYLTRNEDGELVPAQTPGEGTKYIMVNAQHKSS